VVSGFMVYNNFSSNKPMTDQDKLISKTLMEDFGIDNMTLEEFIALGENFDPEEYDKQVRIDLGLEANLND
jgi:hypothetical protein